MQVITITTEAFQQLIDKIDAIPGSIKKNPNSTPDLSEKWLDNDQFCKVLKISKRTAQNYRDNSVISFSQYGSKIYYKAEDIENHLLNHYKKREDLS